jgi:hypothetical protein
MPANTTQSRRRPWPYDAYIGTQRVMLVPDDDGQLIGRKTRTLDQSAPVTFEYGSANPFKERTFLWNKLYSGMGQAIAPSAPETPRRYSYATRVDTSIDGYWMKGPNFEDHVETVNAGAGEVRQLVKALHGGVETVFAVCENGVYRRTADGSWTASLTAGTTPALPAGQFPQQAVRFRGRHAASIDALYLGTATGNIWQYTGAAWVQAASAEGPGTGALQGECRYVEVVGDELWVAGDYWVVKVEENPLLRANYAAVIYIGDQSSKITWLRQIDNTLFIFKEESIFTVSTSGLDQDLFPTLRGRRSATNGRNAAVWVNQLWIPYGNRTYRLDANGELTPDGLEQLLENTSEIRGEMVAGAGHNTWFFYEVYYNGSGISYLLKHGTWIDDGSGRNIQFLNSAHHGALAQWSKRATCAEIISGVHATGNDRLYVGFSNGTVEWCVLPKTGPNPESDAACEFTTQDSYVYLPIHHSNFQADNKLYRGVSIFGPHLTNTEWIEVEYRVDITNTAAAWVVLDSADPKFTIPGQRKEFPIDSPVYGRAIQFRVKLVKDPSSVVSPKQFSPVIDGIAVHEQIRPSISLEYTFNINASSFAVRRNGTVVRQRGSTLKESLLSLMGVAGTTIIQLPDGDLQEMTLVDYQEGWMPAQKRRDLEFVITLQAIQLETITQTQVSSGLTYKTLETFTLGELEAIL